MSLTPMPTKRKRPAPGAQVELTRYEVPEGERILVGQRIHGRVAIVDVPAGAWGRVYLVERAVPSKTELDGIVWEYRERSQCAGEPALLASLRIFDDTGL